MQIARLVVFLVAFFSLAAPGAAQVGPKDGHDLAPTDLERIQAGQRAPDFSLESAEGKTVTLSDFRGKKNVVLVFYRGYW